VQVEGVFALNFGQMAGSWAYSSPKSGIMYFECPQGAEAQCRMEWADFKAAIGTMNCAGFGQNYTPPGTIRAKNMPLGNPDPWPVNMTLGVYLTQYAGGTCDQLRNHSEGDGGLVPTDSGSNPNPMPTNTGNPGNPNPGGMMMQNQKPTTSGGNGCSIGGDAAPALPIGSALLLSLIALLRPRRQKEREG
jgi:hypothetical protein